MSHGNATILRKSIAKNRVRVHLKTKLDANNLVTNHLLNQEKLKAFIPSHLLETKGLIKGVDTSFDAEYLSKYDIQFSGYRYNYID